MSDIDPRFEMLCQMMVQNAKTIALLEAENERLRKALGDLIGLAEAAMRDANRDGAEYDINAELTDARKALKCLTS